MRTWFWSPRRTGRRWCAWFPNRSQFSRIITRVNFKEGAVFADPADSAAPFGELPWFDRAFMGLAVKGSKIQEAVIPAGRRRQCVHGKTTMRVAKDWTVEGDSEIELKGAEAIEFRADLMEEASRKAGAALDGYLRVWQFRCRGHANRAS